MRTLERTVLTLQVGCNDSRRWCTEDMTSQMFHRYTCIQVRILLSSLSSCFQQLPLYDAHLHVSKFLLKSTPKILSARDKCFLASFHPPTPTPVLGPEGYTWPLSEKVLHRFATRAARAKATCSPGCFIFQSDNLGDMGLVWSPPSKNERDHSLLCPVFCKLPSLAEILLGFLPKT